LDFCINEINGRYPEKGYFSNLECEELCYVLEGKGTIYKRDDKDFGFEKGDIIKEINGHKINTRDDISLYLTIDKHDKATKFVVTKEDGSTKTYKVTPEKKIKDDQVTYVYGGVIWNI